MRGIFRRSSEGVSAAPFSACPQFRAVTIACVRRRGGDIRVSSTIGLPVKHTFGATAVVAFHEACKLERSSFLLIPRVVMPSEREGVMPFSDLMFVPNTRRHPNNTKTGRFSILRQLPAFFRVDAHLCKLRDTPAAPFYRCIKRLIMNEIWMYRSACKVEFRPFNRSYSQLTFFQLFVIDYYPVNVFVVCILSG